MYTKERINLAELATKQNQPLDSDGEVYIVVTDAIRCSIQLSIDGGTETFDSVLKAQVDSRPHPHLSEPSDVWDELSDSIQTGISSVLYDVETISYDYILICWQNLSGGSISGNIVITRQV